MINSTNNSHPLNPIFISKEIDYVIDSLGNAVNNQHGLYQTSYLLQAIPVIGAIPSVPTALISGIMAVAKVSQAVFLNAKEGLPFFRSPEDKKRIYTQYPMEDAIDLSIIFVNSILNIFTIGLLNNFLVFLFTQKINSSVRYEVNTIKKVKNEEEPLWDYYRDYANPLLELNKKRES